MNAMFYRRLTSTPSTPGSVADRFVTRALGLMAWAMLATVGLVFALSLAVWLSVMLVVSLIASVFTGRPAAVTMLWRRYREMTRQRWPQRGPLRRSSATPRADAASATGASPAAQAGARQVEDVAWRELPAQPAASPARESGSR